ncbi:hypothetical protein [Variovorax ginsengisoli]|uniref:Uncharacterized protein n=1 Tax=Variovorax ginsengisoli TaxID=363844 RepID=A0ABT8SH51_9BURK|nr:hypothetical protein [Variovorax ginsengisoli]MDN8618960.1 hypothetical protein [Variovorax ginsengisoli]MDO1538130.1 hypothetical protein [Variovorax ginsengisoli]
MLSFADELARGGLIRPVDVARALDIQRHLSQVVQRFLYSVQQLNGTMQRIVEEYTRDSMMLEGLPQMLSGECLADSLLNYLGTVVDDVAIVIALALQFQSNRDDSMGGIKNAWLQNHPRELAPVGPLLAELDQPGSWWDDLFKTRAGMRQLVVHKLMSQEVV